MKPRENQDISKARVATLHGGSVEPVSTLAAKEADQHAERFTFDDKDRDLLAEVLSPERGRAGGEDSS
jgi:hypothetical protein